MSVGLHPYLNFDGRTAEAMAFYQRCLGGELSVMRFAGSPMPHAPEHADRVMHASLKAGDVVIMASDTRPGEPAVHGNGVNLSLNFDNEAELRDTWAKLSEGATITMALEQQFFGLFGVLTDRFGLSWMVHYAAEQQG